MYTQYRCLNIFRDLLLVITRMGKTRGDRLMETSGGRLMETRGDRLMETRGDRLMKWREEEKELEAVVPSIFFKH